MTQYYRHSSWGQQSECNADNCNVIFTIISFISSPNTVSQSLAGSMCGSIETSLTLKLFTRYRTQLRCLQGIFSWLMTDYKKALECFDEVIADKDSYVRIKV